MVIMKKIEKWKKLTDKITEQFIRDYFEIEQDEEITVDWVGNDVGGLFEFADMYFKFDTVLKCYELGITKKQLFGWYEYTLHNEFVNISLARFLLSPEERTKQDKESLEKSKKDLEYIEEIFKKTMDKYEK